MNKDFYRVVNNICEQDTRYKPEVYEFVMEALTYTQKKYKIVKHATSEELLKGIKDYSIELFGPLAMTVFNFWGVKDTVDFGNIVFNMVNNKVLTKTEQDKIEQFKDGFDFDNAFRKEYRDRLHKEVSKLR
ncbi:MAG: hypothetical protein HQL25_07005 [Candidatus Omnitrophica bacterium]|nr:hypothetical protein [Candidatus Omnitrophota bacterium]